MWKEYALFKCSNCGFLRKSSIRVYKYDEDGFHYEAFSKSSSHVNALEKARKCTCPKCKSETPFTFVGWQN